MLWQQAKPSSAKLWKRISERRRIYHDTLERASKAIEQLDPERPPSDWTALHLQGLYESFDEYVHLLFAGSRRTRLSSAVKREFQAALDLEYASLLAVTGLALLGAYLDMAEHGNDHLWLGLRNAPRIKQFIWLRERIAANLQISLPTRWSVEITQLEFYRLNGPMPLAFGLLLIEAYRLGAAHSLVENCVTVAATIQSLRPPFSSS